jgi:hypothetical protein
MTTRLESRVTTGRPRPESHAMLVPTVQHEPHAPVRGQSLDPDARASLESMFGHDFSRVRVHAESGARDLSASLDARAVTFGEDVFFAENEYAPGTPEGRHLLAHELAHVVQQSRFGPPTGSRVSRSTDAAEADADAAADAVVTGRTPSVSASPGDGIARKGDEEGHGFLHGLASLAAPFVPFGDAVMGTVHGAHGVQEMAEGNTAKGALGLASMGTGVVSTAAELGGFHVLGHGGTTALSALGPEALGTMGWAGPAAAVVGAGLGGAAFGTYLSEETQVGENSVGMMGRLDRMLGGDPDSGKSSIVALDEYRQEQWDEGGLGYLTGTGALLAEAGLGTAAAVGGIAEGAYNGVKDAGSYIADNTTLDPDEIDWGRTFSPWEW